MRKFRIRKTGEIVDVICFGGNSTERSDTLDYVSYIDSKGVEHYREPLNYYWDLEEIESTEIAERKKDIDWEERRFLIAKDLFANNDDIDVYSAVEAANDLIRELKKFKEE